MSNQDQDTITKLAVAIGNVIQLHMNRPEIRIAMNQQMDAILEDSDFQHDFDFQYAEAIFHWRSAGKPEPAYFSTASPILLALRTEMEKEFGLEIVDPKAAKRREAAMPTHRKVVNGWQTGHKATQDQLDAQYTKDMFFLKKNKIPLMN